MGLDGAAKLYTTGAASRLGSGITTAVSTHKRRTDRQFKSGPSCSTDTHVLGWWVVREWVGHHPGQDPRGDHQPRRRQADAQCHHCHGAALPSEQGRVEGGAEEQRGSVSLPFVPIRRCVYSSVTGVDEPCCTAAIVAGCAAGEDGGDGEREEAGRHLGPEGRERQGGHPSGEQPTIHIPVRHRQPQSQDGRKGARPCFRVVVARADERVMVWSSGVAGDRAEA